MGTRSDVLAKQFEAKVQEEEHACRVCRRHAHHDRWAFHRNGRGDHQLWDDPGELDGRSGRMSQVLPRLERRCDRGFAKCS